MSLDIYQYYDNFSKIKNVNCELIYGDRQNVAEPLISIIITVYKRKEYILEAIHSAIEQKNVQFEYEIIVISDDPDDSLNELRQFINVKNVYLYRNSLNIGLYNSCNIGAKIARGKYISFLHDDDLLYSNYLSEIHNFISFIKPDTECILTNRDTIGDYIHKDKIKKSKITTLLKSSLFLFYLIRSVFRKSYKLITLKEGLTYQLSNVYKAPTCGDLFKKGAFIESGGFNQDFWPVTDYFFFLNFNQNHKIYMIRKKVACYRWFNNLSQNKAIQFLSLKLLRDFFRSRQSLKLVNTYFKLFSNEVVYAKYLMVNERFRDEIKQQYPEVVNLNKVKWTFFKLYNIVFRFFHDII
jgi:glycosyltransferase involved in cell wall biosynthesis